MRIIAGDAKGRRLATPRGSGTRPLTGKAKEALFSSLGPVIVDARVLDLFAGSGSIGLEALSRGAARVVFVERDRHAVEALEKNVAAIGLGGEIVVGDAREPGANHAIRGPFDVVFIDPPYAMPTAEVAAILGTVVSLVCAGATVVVHRRAGDPMPSSVGSLSVTSQRRYGDTELWRYEAHEEVPQ